MHDTEDPFVSPKFAAQFLALSPATIYRHVQQGDLPATRFGSKTIRIRLSDIESFGTPVTVSLSEAS